MFLKRMQSMRKRKNNNDDLNNVIDIKIINNVFETIEIKYSDFKEYFDENYFDYLYKNITITSNESSINLQLSILLENLTIKYLCDLASAGNIDILIMLVDKFSSLLRTIKTLGKLDNAEINDEDLLINALETYQPDKLFSLHLSSCYKNLFKKEEFSEKVKKYAIEENYYQTKTDKIIRTLDIYNCELVKDEELNIFIYLKYGYYNDFYFSLDTIANILEIPYSTVINLYKKSLILAKEVSNSYIKELKYNKK